MNSRRDIRAALFAAAAAGALWLAGCGIEGNTTAPDLGLRADFSVDPPSPRVNVRVTFSGAISSGSITGYRWDLDGDGSYDTDFRAVDTVSTVYDQAGIYRVTLQVEGDGGQRDTETRDLQIDP